MLDYTHLEALLAVQNEGSFEGAARVLGMSPIGVATRVRKLEARMGVALLQRKPTRTTQAGVALCKYTSDVVELEDQLLEENRANGLQPPSDGLTLKIAVNDDSLTGWFSQVMSTASKDREQPIQFDVTITDQDLTIDSMKNGHVIAALTSSRQPAFGYKSHHLRKTRYRAVCSPDFHAKYFDQSVTLEAISSAPCIRRSGEDTHCLQWLEQVFDVTTSLIIIRIPSLPNMIDVCQRGMGWAVLPEEEILDQIKHDSLIDLLPDSPLDKDLYWHIAEAMADDLTDLTRLVKKAAKN